MKGKKYDHINRDRNICDKIQYLFMIKTLNKGPALIEPGGIERLRMDLKKAV